MVCECVFKSCLLNSTGSGLLVIPGVYLVLSTLDVVIKDYYFEVPPRLRCSSSLPAVCTVTIYVIPVTHMSKPVILKSNRLTVTGLTISNKFANC